MESVPYAEVNKTKQNRSEKESQSSFTSQKKRENEGKEGHINALQASLKTFRASNLSHVSFLLT